MRASSIVARVKRTLFLPFIFFLVAVVLIFAILYRNIAISQYHEQCQYEDAILARTFAAEIENVKNCTNMIIIHLNEMLDRSYLDEELYPIAVGRTQTRISKCMLDAFTTFANLNQILIVWDNGVMFYEDWQTNYFLSSGSVALAERLSTMDITRYGRWLPGMEDNRLLTGEGPVYAKAYVDIATGRHTGYVLLKASPIFATVGGDDHAKRLLLYSPEGELIHSSGAADDLPRGAYTNRIAMANGWSLVSATDLSSELSYLDTVVVEILLLNFLLLLLVYLLTSHLMARVVRPVRELSAHLASGGDELPRPIALSTGDDEIGVLVKRYNEMVEHNRSLVNMLLEERKHEEHLKLSLLQAQIKPHFLYNTLDTIYCLSEMGKKDDASRMTKLLSEYYRHVLSNGLDWVLLTEEVRQTESYLQIQSIRYHDVLDYDIVWQTPVEEARVPKLTLQPIVENAIYHGIKPTGRKGHLTITLGQADASIEIRIIDDGVGMTEEALAHIIGEARTDDAGFGLRNVYERLRLYYGDRFSMAVEPMAAHTGTCLLIILPAVEEEL